jgi:hypothetical protein
MEYSIEDLLDEDEKGKKLSDLDKRFIRLRATGSTVRDIARRLKKSASTICDLNKKYFSEITDIRNAELAELQKKIYEQKQSRLDFLNQQFLIVWEKINHTEVIMRYESMVKLALKISDSINKCERDMQITDCSMDNSSVTNNNPVTSVTEKNVPENTVNMEIKKKKKSVCNKVTNSSGYKSSEAVKINSASAPHSRADFWLKASKNKPKSPT